MNIQEELLKIIEQLPKAQLLKLLDMAIDLQAKAKN